MLTGLTLGETPLSPAPGASSLPPASTKKPLGNEKKRRSRNDMKVEKTVDRRQKVSKRLAELQQERNVLESRLGELLPHAGLHLKQVLDVINELEDVEESIQIVEAEKDV